MKVGSRRSQWAHDIIVGELENLRDVFETAGTPPPTIVWAPTDTDLRAAPNRFLLRYWHELAQGAPPDVSRLDPVDLKTALGYVNLVEPTGDGADFRYRVYGSFIATVSQRDLNNQLMSELDASRHVVDLEIAAARATLICSKPLLVRRIPANAKETSFWERLVLPFAAGDGDVARLLIGVVPMGMNGEPIRPAL